MKVVQDYSQSTTLPWADIAELLSPPFLFIPIQIPLDAGARLVHVGEDVTVDLCTATNGFRELFSS